MGSPATAPLRIGWADDASRAANGREPHLRHTCRRLTRARRTSPVACSPAEAVVERAARRRNRRCTRPSRAGAAVAASGGPRGLIRIRIPRGGLCRRRCLRCPNPCHAPLRSRTPGAADDAHRARRTAGPTVADDRSGRAAARTARRRTAVDRLGARQGAHDDPRHRLRHRHRRTAVDHRQGERGARAAARPARGGRRGTPAAGPSRRPAAGSPCVRTSPPSPPRPPSC